MMVISIILFSIQFDLVRQCILLQIDSADFQSSCNSRCVSCVRLFCYCELTPHDRSVWQYNRTADEKHVRCTVQCTLYSRSSYLVVRRSIHFKKSCVLAHGNSFLNENSTKALYFHRLLHNYFNACTNK